LSLLYILYNIEEFCRLSL